MRGHNNMIEILKAGPFTTIQDRGRIGYQHLGVPNSGALDSEALSVGNHLLRNAPDDAAIEICFGGFHGKATAPLTICLTGSQKAVIRHHSQDGTSSDHKAGTIVAIQANDTLEIPPFGDSLSALLCVGGGITTKPVYGSRATTTNANLGGLDGRVLQEGDQLPVGASPDDSAPHPAATTLDESLYASLFTKPERVRLMLGPQDFWFTNEAIETLCKTIFTISPQTSRMGMRLQGAVLAHKGPADIISDGMVKGTIQVPADGQPIIAMADHGTMGGYTKIACVIEADLASLSRLRPQDKVQFEIVTAKEAQQALRKRQSLIKSALI